MQRHFQEQLALYGEQNLVNLVNRSGHERPVKEAYENTLAQVRISGCGLSVSPDVISLARSTWSEVSLL